MCPFPMIFIERKKNCTLQPLRDYTNPTNYDHEISSETYLKYDRYCPLTGWTNIDENIATAADRSS
jgi:hypothetical protein